MTPKNPWLGLASYEEPKYDGTDYQFCGRDEETLEMVRLIDNNLFVTLYGSSGIGKTSLLRAGVIPILRRKDYFPLYVRLSQEPKKISFAEAIVRKLQGCGLIEEKGAAAKHSDCNDRLFLWEYFATTRFLKEGREVYPVIILDQFEEVFREGDKAKAELLLKQVYLLLNDELEMPDEAGWSSDTNYRFVASIREDFLFVLEDSIDENSLDLYKNNRYRLRPMKQEQARQVVLMPGKDCIGESEKETVAERIITLAKRPQSDDIDTLLLSLVCAGTYDKKNGEKITFADLAVWKDNPMEVYYKDAIKGLSDSQIRYIQQHFIRDDGSRRRVDLTDVKTFFGEAAYNQLTQSANRLFTIGDKGKVELLHDQLGLAVYEERKAFEEQERKKRLWRRMTLFGIITIAIAGFFFFQNNKLKKSQLKMMENQARVIAEKATQLVDEGDSYLARLIALQALPPNRPYTPEAEKALRLSSQHNDAVLRGHTLYVHSASFSPDGKRIVSASDDKTSRIWDAQTGRELQKLVGHTDEVNSASFSPDGKHIVSASSDETVRIWDSQTGCELQIMRGHTRPVISASFSPDGKRIVSASNDSTVRIWDAETGQELQKLEGHTNWVESACFSPDGMRIVSASDDKTVRIWDAQTGRELRKLEGHTGTVHSACFSPNGQRIVSASGDITVRIWDVQTGRELRKLEGHTISVSSACFSPDGQRIVSASGDKTVRIWDVQTGRELRKLEGHTSSVSSACFSPDGKFIVSASWDQTVRIWDTQTGRELRKLEGHTSFVNSASFSPDGKRIVSASLDKTVCIWDAKTGRELQRLEWHTSYVKSASFSPDGKRIASASNDSTVRIWDAQTGQELQKLEGHTGVVNSACFSSDGKRIVSASGDKTVRIWDVQTGRELRKLEGHTSSVYSASFSFDGKFIVSASWDQTVRIWDTQTGCELRKLEGHTSSVSSASFSPDGKRIVSASWDNTVRIWDAETGQELQKLEGHTSWFQSASFSPDGKHIVSASWDNTVRIWDVQTGKELQKLEGHTRAVLSASFSPDGKKIVSSSLDGTICIWDFPPLQQLINDTRERFKNRPLTPEERRKYYLE